MGDGASITKQETLIVFVVLNAPIEIRGGVFNLSIEANKLALKHLKPAVKAGLRWGFVYCSWCG